MGKGLAMKDPHKSKDSIQAKKGNWFKINKILIFSNKAECTFKATCLVLLNDSLNLYEKFDHVISLIKLFNVY